MFLMCDKSMDQKILHQLHTKQTTIKNMLVNLGRPS